MGTQKVKVKVPSRMVSSQDMAKMYKGERSVMGSREVKEANFIYLPRFFIISEVCEPWLQLLEPEAFGICWG